MAHHPAGLWARLVEPLLLDTRYAARMLVRHVGFTVPAVLTLGLGIGANTAVFSVVDTVVFRPLPYADAERLVKIWGNAPVPTDDVSLPDFLDIRALEDVFEGVAADDGTDLLVTHRGLREPVNGALVTADWLRTLGVQPMLGRGFRPEEFLPGGDSVVILTHEYWRRRFAADPAIVGQVLSSEEGPSLVVGVLPPNVLRYTADFVRPLVAAEYPTARNHRDLDVFARLQPGVTIGQARTRLETVSRRLQMEYPATNKDQVFKIVPLEKYYASVQPSARRGLLLMFGAVALVLFISCVNVANLLLARGVGRYRECVVRSALGASRARVIRQVLVENVLLFLLGGALGFVLAEWSVGSLSLLARTEGYVPDRLAIAVDARVLTFSLIVSLVTGLAVGLAPAVQASRVDVNDGLRASSATVTHGRARGRVRRVLIVAEMTLSLVLLVGFGLLARSFLQLQAAPKGFRADRLLETLSDGGRDFDTAVVFWRAALERARAVPGVESVALASRPPIHGSRSQHFTVGGRPPRPSGALPLADDILVSADYFRTMEIPLVRGRGFTDADTGSAPPVVIVSQAFARRQLPGEDPIGKRISLIERAPMSCCSAAGPVENVWREIVGVAGDIRQANLDEAPASTIYRPYTQIVEHDMYLMARVSPAAEVSPVSRDLRASLVSVDAARVWADVRSMSQVIGESESVRLRRFVVILLGGFAALALLLAAVGLYGVMAHSVAERRREIAIRVALGASRPVVIRQVLREAGRLTIAGIALGWVAARVLTRLIAALLFGVTGDDAVTYAAVSILLGGVALLASYVPARRASRIDPVVALRD